MKKVIILIVLLLGIAFIIYMNRTEDVSKTFNAQIHRNDFSTNSFVKTDSTVKINATVKHTWVDRLYKGTVTINDQDYILNHMIDNIYILSSVENGRTKTCGTLEFNQNYTFIDIFEN